MSIAMYTNYGYYLSTEAALTKLKEHGVTNVVAWIGRDIEQSTSIGEHELYGLIRDNGLKVDAAFVPGDNLPYLSNSMYGRKDALKAYKQYILSAADLHIPTLILDAAPSCAPLVEALKELCDFATEQGITLALRDGQGVDTVGLLSAVPTLYYCLDTVACQKNEVNILNRLESVKARLLYVLLGDLESDGARALPGYGNTDFAPIIAAVKACGYRGRLGIYATQGKKLQTADAFIEAAKTVGA